MLFFRLRFAVRPFWLVVSVLYVTLAVLHFSFAQSILKIDADATIEEIKKPVLFVDGRYAELIETLTKTFNHAAATNRKILFAAAVGFIVAAAISLVQGLGIV